MSEKQKRDVYICDGCDQKCRISFIPRVSGDYPSLCPHGIYDPQIRTPWKLKAIWV
jgi:tRNA A37 methylthiotransferase MiaB